jgi:hypothetical protein
MGRWANICVPASHFVFDSDVVGAAASSLVAVGRNSRDARHERPSNGLTPVTVAAPQIWWCSLERTAESMSPLTGSPCAGWARDEGEDENVS